MGFLDDYNLDDVPEEHASPEGELELALTSAKLGLNKNQKAMITALYTVPNDPNAQIIGDYITLPNEDMDERQYNQARRRLKEFTECLGIPADISEEDFNKLGEQGLTVWAYITQREYEGRTVNNVRSYSNGPSDKTAEGAES